MKLHHLAPALATVAILLGAGTLVAQLARLPAMSTGHGRMVCGSCAEPAPLTAEVSLALPAEPGERIEISGTVFQADGRTPAGSVVLFIYQTDATGHYNREDDPFQPRLRGWMRTGSDGRYKIRTIKPGAYPNHSEPAHLHVHRYGPGLSEWFFDDLLFADDPLIKLTTRSKFSKDGSFSPIVRLQRGTDGISRGVRDLRITARDR